jgi:hypothetical protein
MISTVHTIWQSKQEVRDKRASYARVSILMYFSECQRIVPADAPFLPTLQFLKSALTRGLKREINSPRYEINI